MGKSAPPVSITGYVGGFNLITKLKNIWVDYAKTLFNFIFLFISKAITALISVKSMTKLLKKMKFFMFFHIFRKQAQNKLIFAQTKIFLTVFTHLHNFWCWTYNIVSKQIKNVL